MAANDTRLNPAELQSIVDSAAERAGIAGGQVSVVRGEERCDLAFGSANVELDTPMTVDTLIQIGSATKMLNAALVMTLVEEDKLSLDAPIRDAIPDLRLADMQALERITLRRLLSMSSGLDNGPYTDHGAGTETLGRYIDSLADVPQAFQPGDGWGYSNAGTSIAGFACERVTGETWDQLLKSRILEPAGLKEAATLAEDLLFHRVSAGHTPATADAPASVIKPWYMQRSQGPAGSTLAMSARNLAGFGEFMLHGGQAKNGTAVLSAASVKAMTTPTSDVPSKAFADVWGLGPYRLDWQPAAVWGHAGGNQSGTSYLVWIPDRDAVLAIVVNTPATGQRLVREMFETLGPMLFDTAPIEQRETIDADIEFASYVGKFTAYAMDYDVTADADRLHITASMRVPGQDWVVMFDGAVEPLGNHRFTMTSPLGDPSEVAFFNPGSEGRMQNLVAPTFPARRAG